MTDNTSDSAKATLTETITKTMDDHRVEDALQKAQAEVAKRPYTLEHRYDSMSDRYFFTATKGNDSRTLDLKSDTLADGGFVAVLAVFDGYFDYEDQAASS